MMFAASPGAQPDTGTDAGRGGADGLAGLGLGAPLRHVLPGDRLWRHDAPRMPVPRPSSTRRSRFGSTARSSAGMPWTIPARCSAKWTSASARPGWPSTRPTTRPTSRSPAQASYNVAPFRCRQGISSRSTASASPNRCCSPAKPSPCRSRFYVDPEIVNDRDAQTHAPRITLSYTFHEIDLPQEQAALDLRPSDLRHLKKTRKGPKHGTYQEPRLPHPASPRSGRSSARCPASSCCSAPCCGCKGSRRSCSSRA